MVIKPEHDRVRTLIADTVSLLCKNGLSYTKEFSIEGLLGITLDKDEVFLVNIKEIVKSETSKFDSGSESGEDDSSMLPAKRRKRRRSSQKNTSDEWDNSDNDTAPSVPQISEDVPSVHTDIAEPSFKNIKQEEDNSDDDLVFVKDEPSTVQPFNLPNTTGAQIQNSNILGDLSQHGQLFGTPVSDALPNTSPWDTSQSMYMTSPHNQSNLNASISSTPGQQHVCSSCGAAYNSRSSLLWHVKLKHEGRYPYRCRVCGKGSTNRQHMLTHESRHVVLCRLCALPCVSSDALLQHMVNCHSQQQSPNQEDKGEKEQKQHGDDEEEDTECNVQLPKQQQLTPAHITPVTK